MFLAILPLSVSDSHLVDGWVSVLRALGGAMKCHFLLVPTPHMRTKAKYAAAAMQGFCASVEVRPLEVEPQGEFPRASNEHFKGAMFARGKLSNEKRSLPFIWMELDALPLIENWDDRLYKEYALECNSSGWLGVLCPMVKEIKRISREVPQKQIQETLRKTNGTLVIDEEDLYMEGVGIYPWNFDVLTQRQWAFTKGAPFDQKLRHYAKRDWHNTELIQSRWRTGNYKIDPESGEVMGEDLPDANPHGTVHGGPIHAGVVLFHGCKDVSLQKIIAESRNAEIMPVEKMAQVEVHSKAPILATAAKAQGNTRTQAPKGFRLPVRQPKATKGDSPEPDDDNLTVEKVAERVKASSKNQHIDIWAKELDVPVSELEELVNKSDGRLKITGVARWLKAA